jgi:hypothetical protein
MVETAAAFSRRSAADGDEDSFLSCSCRPGSRGVALSARHLSTTARSASRQKEKEKRTAISSGDPMQYIKKRSPTRRKLSDQSISKLFRDVAALNEEKHNLTMPHANTWNGNLR